MEKNELRRHTTSIELANGYINRVLLIACRRQRLLPEGGDPDPLAGTGLDRLLAAALRQARKAGQVRLDNHARELWHHAYRKLATEPHDRIVAQITARAEAHVIRLALLYTLTDGKHQIAAPHLTAALRPVICADVAGDSRPARPLRFETTLQIRNCSSKTTLRNGSHP